MNDTMLKLPSFYMNVTNGILLLLAIYILVVNFSEIKTMESYKIIVLVLLFSTVVGIHGLLHLGMEKSDNTLPISLEGL